MRVILILLKVFWVRIFFLFLGFIASVQAAETLLRFDPSTETKVLPLPNGAYLTSQIRTPQAAGDTTRFPAIIIIGSFGATNDILQFFGPEYRYVIATFDGNYPLPKNKNFFQILLELPQLKQYLRETSQNIDTLYHYLRDRSDVDPTRMGIIGISLGAPFAIIAAHKESDLNPIVLVNGFTEFPPILQRYLVKKFSFLPDWIAQYPARLITTLMQFYFNAPSATADAQTLARNKKILILEGTQDSIIPPSSRDNLLQDLGKSKAWVQRVVMPGHHIFLDSKSAIENLMAIVSSSI